MRMELISLSLSVCNIVHVGVDFLDKDEEPYLRNFNKFIAMLKLARSFYPHWKNMSLIESMVLRRPKTFGTLFKEPMKAPSP
jgi:hypothetical protein